jgi:hypothetical protein
MMQSCASAAKLRGTQIKAAALTIIAITDRPPRQYTLIFVLRKFWTETPTASCPREERQFVQFPAVLEPRVLGRVGVFQMLLVLPCVLEALRCVWVRLLHVVFLT